MAVRRACVTLCCCALAAFVTTGCANLTRPDPEPRPDPVAAVATTKLAVLDRLPAAAPKALDVVALDPAPGRLHDLVPSSANPAPAAPADARGGGGG
jgi:hypothetical protein